MRTGGLGEEAEYPSSERAEKERDDDDEEGLG